MLSTPGPKQPYCYCQKYAFTEDLFHQLSYLLFMFNLLWLEPT